MSGQRRSLQEGLTSLAQAGVVVAAEVVGVGVELATSFPLDRGGPVVWDDGEERRYREWVRAEVGDRPEAEWAEYKAETDHRTQCRADTEARAGNQVEWEDGAERLLRARYTALRESGELVWDCSGERVEQERCRREQDQRRNQPVTWDDADERAYMESYRKKYNK